MTTNRKTLPSKEVIFSHWKAYFDLQDDEKNSCWACIHQAPPQRCHLIPYQEDNNNPENIVLLCPTCHQKQEAIVNAYGHDFALKWIMASRTYRDDMFALSIKIINKMRSI